MPAEPPARPDEAATPDAPGRPAQPLLRVVRGDAGAEEIAAIVAVLALRGRGPGEQATRTPIRSAWSDRSRLMRAPLAPSPGGWRRSALPR